MIQFRAALEIIIYRQDVLKKRMKRDTLDRDIYIIGIWIIWKKIDDHPVHTSPNHDPPKMDVLPKRFLQITIAAKYLVQH